MNGVGAIARGLVLGTRYVTRVGDWEWRAGRFWSRADGTVYCIKVEPAAEHLQHLNARFHDPHEAAKDMVGWAVWIEDPLENRTIEARTEVTAHA